MMIRKLGKTIAATALAVSLAFAPTLTMADEGDAAPSGAARVGAGIVDVLFGRTTLLMATVAGSAFYVIALPITLPSGSERDARERFVIAPWTQLTSPIGGD